MSGKIQIFKSFPGDIKILNFWRIFIISNAFSVYHNHQLVSLKPFYHQTSCSPLKSEKLEEKYLPILSSQPLLTFFFCRKRKNFDWKTKKQLYEFLTAVRKVFLDKFQLCSLDAKVFPLRFCVSSLSRDVYGKSSDKHENHGIAAVALANGALKKDERRKFIWFFFVLLKKMILSAFI